MSKSDDRSLPKSGEIFQHFKGNLYQIDFIATHTESKFDMVVYHRMNDGKKWIRPLDMFMSEVDHEKYPEVKQKYRFERV